MQFEKLSDIGKKRTVNEDSVAIFTHPEGITLAVIADGMGGHLGGDFASSTAVEVLGEAFMKIDVSQYSAHEDWMEWLKETVLYANRYLYNQAKENEALKGMGTTLEAILIKDRSCLGVHIGDSRVYVIRKEGIEQITTDHSYVNVLVDSGEITEQEAEVHPQRNWIMKALGSERSIDPDCYSLELEEESYLLLCTDGLSNKLEDSLIQSIVLSNVSARDAVRELIDTANEMGGEDNISVILLGPDRSEVSPT